MTNRITRVKVTLPESFLLAGLHEPVPAGSYEITTEEESLGDVMYPAYRRLSATIYLPQVPGRIGAGQVIEIAAMELNALLEHQAVDHNLNRVIFLLVQLNRFIEIVKQPINPSAHITGSCQVLQLFLELAFASPDDWRQNHDARAFRQGFQMAHNLIGCLPGNRLTALEAVGDAYRREQETQIVVNLRDCSNCGPRAPGCGFLLDGNRR